MKKIFILIGLLALAALVCVGCGKKVQSDAGTLNGTELVSTSTQELIYKNSSYTLRFNRNDAGDWQWKDDTTIPLDQSKVQELLNQVNALNVLVPLEDPGDITTYDLDSPDRTLEVKDADGSGISLQIGSAAEGGGYYMCRDGDTAKIYVVPDALVQMMDRNIYELVQIPAVPVVAAEALTGIEAQGGGVSVSAQRSDDGMWLAEGKDVSEPLAGLVELLGQGLALESCVDYNPSSGALPICGLTEPTVTATVHYTAANGTAGSFTVKVGFSYEDGYFAMYNDVPAIFKVSAGTAQLLTEVLSLAG